MDFKAWWKSVSFEISGKLTRAGDLVRQLIDREEGKGEWLQASMWRLKAMMPLNVMQYVQRTEDQRREY